jgi:protein gp37
MAENSAIEWTDHTFNPWIGCQEVSAACDHCYARVMNERWGWVEGWGPHGERKRTSPSNWKKPLQWAKAANGARPKVFCASLADVFDNRAPAGALADLWQLIRATPELDWLLLTKRPENIKARLPDDWRAGWANVWLGTTCEDQDQLDRRWPKLNAIPAHRRFISYEPALGPLRLQVFERLPDWIICGGESGAGARPMSPDWVRSVRDQCSAAGVAFFFKQWGGQNKAATGRLLDGRTWDEMPARRDAA